MTHAHADDLSFAQSGGQLLFHLISRLHEQTSIIVTTHVAFGEWHSLLAERGFDISCETVCWWVEVRAVVRARVVGQARHGSA